MGCVNRLLGKDIKENMSKDQFQVMIEFLKRKNYFAEDECKIMNAAMDLKKTTVQKVMTLLDDTNMLSVESYIDRDLIKNIYVSGHSRFPVYENERTNIIGVIFTKDLVIL